MSILRALEPIADPGLVLRPFCPSSGTRFWCLRTSRNSSYHSSYCRAEYAEYILRAGALKVVEAIHFDLNIVHGLLKRRENHEIRFMHLVNGSILRDHLTRKGNTRCIIVLGSIESSGKSSPTWLHVRFENFHTVGYPPYLRPETCYFDIPTTKRQATQQSPLCSVIDRMHGRSDAHQNTHHSSFRLGRYFRISLISCSTTGFLIISPHFLYLDIYMVLCLIPYISPSILAHFNFPNIFISLGTSTVVEIV